MDNVLITSQIAGLTPDFQKKINGYFFNQSEKTFATHELQTNQVKLSAGYVK